MSYSKDYKIGVSLNNMNENKLKGVKWSPATIEFVDDICRTTGRGRQFSSVSESLVLGAHSVVLNTIDVSISRRLALAIAMIDDDSVTKARAELVSLFDDIAALVGDME